LTSLFFDDINFSGKVEERYLERGSSLAFKPTLSYEILAVSRKHCQQDKYNRSDFLGGIER